tara:strand:+ start:768 stop:1022 length:255 start_codon:yes stop_codon:yes gene_type:complete
MAERHGCGGGMTIKVGSIVRLSTLGRKYIERSMAVESVRDKELINKLGVVIGRGEHSLGGAYEIKWNDFPKTRKFTGKMIEVVA